VPALTQSTFETLIEILETHERWAAHAMLKHVYAEHSRETHVRAMAMVTRTAARTTVDLPHLVEENGPEENLPLGHFFGKDSSYAKCVRREVAVAG
jgi:hypothetical protein